MNHSAKYEEMMTMHFNWRLWHQNWITPKITVLHVFRILCFYFFKIHRRDLSFQLEDFEVVSTQFYGFREQNSGKKWKLPFWHMGSVSPWIVTYVFFFGSLWTFLLVSGRYRFFTYWEQAGAHTCTYPLLYIFLKVFSIWGEYLHLNSIHQEIKSWKFQSHTIISLMNNEKNLVQQKFGFIKILIQTKYE